METSVLFLVFGDRVPNPEKIAPQAGSLQRLSRLDPLDAVGNLLFSPRIRLPCRPTARDKHDLATSIVSAAAWRLREQGVLELEAAGSDSRQALLGRVLQPGRLPVAAPTVKLAGRRPHDVRGIEELMITSLESVGGAGAPWALLRSLEQPRKKRGRLTAEAIGIARDVAVSDQIYSETDGRGSTKLAGTKVKGNCERISQLEPEFDRQLGDWIGFCEREGRLAGTLHRSLYEHFNPPDTSSGD